MKQSTRKYAKRQVTWLRNKLLPAIESVDRHSGSGIRVASMYTLDATGVYSLWNVSILTLLARLGGSMDLQCSIPC